VFHQDTHLDLATAEFAADRALGSPLRLAAVDDRTWSAQGDPFTGEADDALDVIVPTMPDNDHLAARGGDGAPDVGQDDVAARDGRGHGRRHHMEAPLPHPLRREPDRGDRASGPLLRRHRLGREGRRRDDDRSHSDQEAPAIDHAHGKRSRRR